MIGYLLEKKKIENNIETKLSSINALHKKITEELNLINPENSHVSQHQLGYL